MESSLERPKYRKCVRRSPAYTSPSVAAPSVRRHDAPVHVTSKLPQDVGSFVEKLNPWTRPGSAKVNRSGTAECMLYTRIGSMNRGIAGKEALSNQPAQPESMAERRGQGSR